jgi:hypothetical protein
MKAISLAATLLLGACVQAAPSDSYPFMLYNGLGNGVPQEATHSVTFHEALNKYKEFVGDATNVVVVVKEGLTSEELAFNAAKYPFLGSLLKLNSFTFTNVQGGFDPHSYESSVHAHQKYTLESLADLPELTQKVSADLKSTNALFKISLVLVSASVPNAQVDKVVKAIDEVAQAVDQKAVYVVAGSVSANALPHTINLQEVDVTSTDDSQPTPTPVTAVGDNYYNGPVKYLFPNALIGLLIAGMIIFFLISGYLFLMSIQTPYVYPTESIDWGKLEK